MAENEKPDFIVLSETHLTKDVDEEEITLRGYGQIATISESTRTGGVIVYFKENCKVEKIFELTSNMKYWINACSMNYKNNCFILVAVYRSPSYSEAEFCEHFEKIVEDLNEYNGEIIITGDFNIDWSSNGLYKRKLESIFNDNGIKQIVSEYTRVTESTRTIIDLVVTNKDNLSVSVNNNNKISDHETININIECNGEESRQVQFKESEYFKYNKHLFSREIGAILNINENDNLNNNVSTFDKCIENTIKKFTKRIRIKEKCNIRWFNRELRLLKQEKLIKYRAAKMENTNLAWNNYKVVRNIYKTKIVNAKNKYICNKINNTKDQKQMWKEIKDLVLKKKHNPIPPVIFDHLEFKESKQIANKFNSFFINSIKDIRDSIEDVQYINQVPVVTSKFTFHAINIQQLKIICKNMKKKPDFNKVSINIILDNWNIVGNKLLYIINSSLETGVFPESWKESMVTPIEKIKKARTSEEYRPINTLKTCEKIIEQIVKTQLEDYMEQNELFSKYQSGFRKSFSCETAVNYVINRWKKIDRNNKVMAIFLDFKRAFETIDREILLQKLYYYGVRDIELKWFKSYLTERKQRTKVNNTISETLNNECGVPQGSILGALLFIIYINDMPNILEKCETVIYADDTLIFTESKNEIQCKENLMYDLGKINNWLKMNKLKLNESKTKLMEINMNTDLVVKINDKVIEKVKSIKYLGFIIDKDLKFKEHIEYICKKIGKKIGFFKRIRNKVSIMTAINVYNVIIKPHFEFGSTILYICCTNTQIERLQKLQNRGMRSILQCNRYTPTQFMLDTLQWLNIQQRIQVNTLKFIKKITTGNAPQYLYEQIEYVGEVQPYSLRNSQNFRLPRVSTSSMQRSLFYKGLKLFNTLPDDTKNERNTKVFNRTIVLFIKNNY